ncbi:MAG TPA: hypothetical protein VFT02_13740 [Pyrinomonadaceae bacterium]|nr:hypothetical protein [Pyrinomonadaceae bacterium]
MRQETNKEIDLLLRRLSRREGEAARGAEIDERHLDADELSSYAQNVLPPAARARYTEHLADCSTCRRMATELSLALGVTTASAPVETVSASSGLKKFLSSLLSPMVLRYAVPALGAIIVMVVGFAVLRQREPAESLIAQADRRDQVATAVPVPSATDSPLAGFHADNQAAPENVKPDKDATVARGNTAGSPPVKSGAPVGTADSAGAAPVPASTPSEVQPVAEVTARSVNAVPVQPPSPKALFDGVDAKKESDEAKKDSGAKQQAPTVAQADTSAEKQKQQPNETAAANLRPAGRVAADKVEQNKAGAETGGVRSLSGGVATRRRDQESRDEDAETRSVAGRKFRKERGIWTDTAYDSSTRTVYMARSSEQFRALVADEPAIKTIAEQLDGEVIVVWKGRAYRIR